MKTVQFLPMSRGRNAMILFAACPPRAIVSALQAARVQVGLAVAGSEAVRNAPLDSLDYVFLGLSADHACALEGAVRDLAREKWQVRGVSRAG